jgi:hypothetical protein
MRNTLLNIITGFPMKPSTLEYIQNTYADIEAAVLGLLPSTGNFILSGFALDGSTRQPGILVVNSELYYFGGDTSVTHVKTSSVTTQETYSDAVARDYVTVKTLVKCASGDPGAIAIGSFTAFPKLQEATASISGFMPAADKAKVDRDLKHTKQVLTYGAGVTWNMNNGPCAQLTLNGNATLSIENMQECDFGTLVVIQGLANCVLTMPAGSKFLNGNFALSTTLGAVDILTFYYDGTNFYWTVGESYE